MLENLPTSLYIHIPWCIKKCPYCDFNSHENAGDLPEQPYIDLLLRDFAQDLQQHPRTHLHSIFIGGGTPSLLQPEAYARLLEGLAAMISFAPEMEITLEANPGTLDMGRFRAYHEVGINRISLGIQSFHDHHLRALGRIHDALTARRAIAMVQELGFPQVNLDLMYALPAQTVEEACFDLNTAIAAQPSHISWYELTIEPNTVFYKKPPIQPQEVVATAMEQQGQDLLDMHGYQRYEISAYAQSGAKCQHNLNYWRFGDYFGIGAGAHGKLTKTRGGIERRVKWKMPNRYLSTISDFVAERQTIDAQSELIFEFFLNAARLLQPISMDWFEQVTGVSREALQLPFARLSHLGLISVQQDGWWMTPKGIQYCNEVINHFLT